jgi:hypothetical protein
LDIIAIPLSCRVAEVVAVDQDASMIAVAELGHFQSRQNIQWLESREGIIRNHRHDEPLFVLSMVA